MYASFTVVLLAYAGSVIDGSAMPRLCAVHGAANNVRRIV